MGVLRGQYFGYVVGEAVCVYDGDLGEGEVGADGFVEGAEVGGEAECVEAEGCGLGQDAVVGEEEEEEEGVEGEQEF